MSAAGEHEGFEGRGTLHRHLRLVAVQLQAAFRVQPRRKQVIWIERAHTAAGTMTIQRVQHAHGMRAVGGHQEATQADAHTLHVGLVQVAPGTLFAARSLLTAFLPEWQGLAHYEEAARLLDSMRQPDGT